MVVGWLRIKKKHQGLGKLQISQRLVTEKRILSFLKELEKQITHRSDDIILETQWANVNLIFRKTRIEKKTLIRTLNRMVSEGKILEKKENENNQRLFCLPNSVNSSFITGKEIEKRIPKKEYQKMELERRKQRRKLFFSSDYKLGITEIIMEIESIGENPDEVFGYYGITKRTYESCIKRSPTLRFIRDKVRYFKTKKISVPNLYFVEPKKAVKILKEHESKIENS